MTTDVKRHTFTADDYHRMVEAGILCEDDRVELLDGEIISMTPVGNRHIAAVNQLAEIIAERLSRRGILQVQSPLRLSASSEPEPDLLLLRRSPDFYRSVPAGPADVLLLIEVSDSSLAYDRDRKVPLYARAGVAEVWLVDVEADCITSYRDPMALGYRSTTTARHGDALSPQAFADIVVAVDELFPPS